MKCRILIVVAVLFLFAAGAQSVIACSCAWWPPGKTIDDFVRGSVDLSEYVFTGKVIVSKKPKNLYREAVTFRILKSWKRRDKKAKRVTLHIPMNDSCYMQYRPGASYMIFAVKSWSEDLKRKREYYLSTDECVGSGPLSDSLSYIAALERLKLK